VLALLSSACIEDRLSVEITTQVLADGTATRRVEYRLERIDSEKQRRVEIAADDDPLRLFQRFPTGDAWTLHDDAKADLHTVLVEGTLANAQLIDGDYSRAIGPRAQPARNFVSFAMDAGTQGDASFDYSETFRDPASPLEGMRALAQGLQKREDEFAARFLKVIGDSPLQRNELRKAFRQRLADPLARDVASVASRPVFGPRERRDLEDLWEAFDTHEKELAEALGLQAPTLSRERIDAALDEVQEPMGAALQRELKQRGLPLPSSAAEPATQIHFKVTLILPGTIVRANTCAAGDTATWEFDQGDLYGGGFEMWARSVTR
jgi:hypothetical protein